MKLSDNNSAAMLVAVEPPDLGDIIAKIQEAVSLVSEFSTGKYVIWFSHAAAIIVGAENKKVESSWGGLFAAGKIMGYPCGVWSREWCVSKYSFLLMGKHKSKTYEDGVAMSLGVVASLDEGYMERLLC